MKRLSFLVLLLAFLAVGCAHRPSTVSSFSSAGSFQAQLVMVSSDSAQITLESPEISVESGDGSSASKENLEAEEGKEEEIATIADPLEPLNRAMFYFNDKLYFWVLKPVAQGYNKVVPEPPRVGVRNFFSNLSTPVRLVNCLLQAKFKGAGNEVARFLLNSIFGIGGFLDLAKRDFNVEKEDRDFGQTLGVWGLGPAFYIDWPILGPSNVRDTLGYVGDLFFDPRTYLLNRPIFYVVRPVELINDTSLRIGDYESLKEAAIDSYVALRDAYAQYRQKMVEAARGKPTPPKPGGVGLGGATK